MENFRITSRHVIQYKTIFITSVLIQVQTKQYKLKVLLSEGYIQVIIKNDDN